MPVEDIGKSFGMEAGAGYTRQEGNFPLEDRQGGSHELDKFFDDEHPGSERRRHVIHGFDEITRP